jgi:hypothetical protein
MQRAPSLTMNAETESKPLLPESSTSESTTVEVVMNDMRDKTVIIPDYQRDSDQWEEPTKSLLVESVINNLSIPAFFFEVQLENSVENNYVIDGQQRLTTLQEFFSNKLRLVDSDEAPYLSPHSVHYANKTFDELPLPYQHAFKKYRLTVIKLRNLDDMRLEVFRRINQGGTPLSGQDIRLAYYGGECAATAFIRIAGIYDPDRAAAKRFLSTAKAKGLEYPWKTEVGREAWHEWWADKEISRGQSASEMVLWSLVSAQAQTLDQLLSNPAALQALNCRFSRAVDEALDAYCAQLKFQEAHQTVPPIFMGLSDMRDKFFPHFEAWFATLLAEKGPGLPVSKNRLTASVIGAAYTLGFSIQKPNGQQWTDIVEFIRRPQSIAQRIGIEWPVSKGRWDGKRGYRAQLRATSDALATILK